MKIQVDVLRQAGGWGRRIQQPEAWARKVSWAALKSLSNHSPVEISVVLSDDAHVRALNHDFRGKNKPTNVLSFPSGEADFLGDVVLAYETVATEAKAQGKTFHDHATHLLVHGILHLLGHNHMKKQEAEIMEKKEIQLLKSFGIANPY